MSKDPVVSTPTAILIAGAMIAVGLFFGLRRPEPAVMPNNTAGSGAVETARPGTTSSNAQQSRVTAGAATQDQRPQRGAEGAPGEPPRSAQTAGENLALATAALEKHRAMMVAKCVSPAMAKQPTPPQVKLTFNLTFDAQGKQLMRGIAEDRATSRAEVTQCVTDQLPALEIPPTGANVYVEVPWTLP